MKSVTKRAYGKLNLTLDVLGKRPDGYHDMRMIMQSVSLCDIVTIDLTSEGGWMCSCDIADVPMDAGNLAYKAADAFFSAYGNRPEHLKIHIEKHIPMQGGMAGGSADAASVLHGLNELYDNPYSVTRLCEIGADVGSDVPYCVLGGTALAEGRGERLTPLKPVPHCCFLLVKPEFSVSTPALFRELDAAEPLVRPDTAAALMALEHGDLFTLCKHMQNVFQPILEGKYPIIQTLCERLVQRGAMSACLTGTGSVVFGVFQDTELAENAAKAIRDAGLEVYLTETV